jgi:allantoicase
MEPHQLNAAAFTGLIDLAAERAGGKVLVASDEFFAPKENLLKPGRGIFIADKYTDRGKWMDGWESRRKRTPGHDWCVIQLGLPGFIKGIDIDTNHFLGNSPAYASVEACVMESGIAGDALKDESIEWKEILSRSPITPGLQNLFSIISAQRWTHVRLNIFPDGGVARFRVYGVVVPDWTRVGPNDVIDLAAVGNGGIVVAASDMFFGSRENLIMPGRAMNMGDGWETKRRRGPGYDWAIVRLGRTGRIKKIEVDTQHFKGNYPDQCSIDVCYEPNAVVDTLTWQNISWKEILPKTKLEADNQHVFEKELLEAGPCTHVRLNIYPDGGVSRLRVWGTLHDAR